jgi:type I restriction enzyme R subunit
VVAWVRPLPFLYQSTGVETRFTSRLDPEPRSRLVFHFLRSERLAEWAAAAAPTATAGGPKRAADPSAPYTVATTLRGRLHSMPPLAAAGLWPAQIRAVRNLEMSLREDRPRSLIQMATGSGKTFTAIAAIYRLIKFGGARRVLFLVDRGNLGRQTLKEFQAYRTPDDGRTFTELYNVQHLQSNRIDPVARVCITTIQRLYSMLRGEAELDPELEEGSQFDSPTALLRGPAPVEYNPTIPIEMFDIIFTDECHRSIYNLWRQVLEYFDAHLVGLTATPSKQTIGFFNQNLVMEYGHEQAVADGVNVDFDVYRIRTQITESGSKVEAGPIVDRRDRQTRAKRWETLGDDLVYGASARSNRPSSPGDASAGHVYAGTELVARNCTRACTGGLQSMHVSHDGWRDQATQGVAAHLRQRRRPTAGNGSTGGAGACSAEGAGRCPLVMRARVPAAWRRPGSVSWGSSARSRSFARCCSPTPGTTITA